MGRFTPFASYCSTSCRPECFPQSGAVMETNRSLGNGFSEDFGNSWRVIAATGSYTTTSASPLWRIAPKIGARDRFPWLPARTQPLPNRYPIDTQSIPNRYPTDTQPTPNRHPTDTQPTPNRHPTDTQPIPNRYPTDTQPIPNRYPTNDLHMPKSSWLPSFCPWVDPCASREAGIRFGRQKWGFYMQQIRCMSVAGDSSSPQGCVENCQD
jgi:hypothetical protein